MCEKDGDSMRSEVSSSKCRRATAVSGEEGVDERSTPDSCKTVSS